MPEGYDSTAWNTRYSMQSRGGVICESCGYKQKHELNWPNDAYYVVMYRHQPLWAFHREAAVELYEYLSESLRDHKNIAILSFYYIFRQSLSKKKRVNM
ncbi:hypothetical protein ACINWC323_1296 [Acinetobacter sp. WC-323]|nr:hypothetical protein ACINWC323_1296 [Acinetobacter sp. WC-323]